MYTYTITLSQDSLLHRYKDLYRKSILLVNFPGKKKGKKNTCSTQRTWTCVQFVFPLKVLGSVPVLTNPSSTCKVAITTLWAGGLICLFLTSRPFFSVITPELTNNLSSLDIFLPSVSGYLIISKGRRYLKLEESWAMMMILF